MGHGHKVFSAMLAQVSALRKVLPQEAVGILVSGSLPWAARITKVDGKPGVDPQTSMLGHLCPLVPSQ